MATHSSILAWRIPWTEELGRLQSMALQTVRHKWATGSEGGHSLGSLVQLCCGEEGTLQTVTASMCGGCLQCIDPIGFAPAQGGLCFLGLHCSGSRLLCRCVVQIRPCVLCTSHKCTGSKLLRFFGTLQRHKLCWVCVLCLSQVQAAKATRCLSSTLSQVGLVS